MPDIRLFVKYVCLLCVIQLSVFLVGCHGTPYEGPGLLPDAGGTPPPDGGPPDGGCPRSEIIVTASVQEGFNPLNVTFNVSSPSGCIDGVNWSFGNGETAETTGNDSILHIYVNPGEHSVGVTAFATNPLSEDYEFEIPITVLPTPVPTPPVPISEIIVTASVHEGFNPLNVTFTVSSPSGAIDRVAWIFGNGESAVTTGNSSISNIYVNPGEHSVGVTAFTTNPFSDDYEFEIPITVLPNVNLVVSSFAIDTEVTPGGVETVSAIIQNIGTDPLEGSGHIDIGYYLSTDNVITVDDIYIGDTSVAIGDSFTQSDVSFGFESLSPGENYQYDHQLAVKGNVPPGTYFAGAMVDYIDEYDWYTFPRATDSKEFAFPVHVTVAETNETDNVRLLLAHQVTVNAPICAEDAFEPDNNSATATPISVGQTQERNFCRDNSDWLQFDAIQGNVYKISTELLGTETDTQLILYDRDGSSILLFHDNIGNDDDDATSPPSACPPGQENDTVDLECGWPAIPRSEIVWETQVTGTYFIKVRTTTCDEDKDKFCETILSTFSPEGFGSPDGVGLDTEYSITLQ